MTSLRSKVQPWLLLALFTGACASSTPARRPEGPPPELLFKSPLALLLEHHQELRLSTDQMIEVGKLDSALQEKNKPLRLKLQELHPRGPGRHAPRGGPGMDGPPPGVSPRSWGTGGRRRSWGGGGSPPREDAPESDEARQQRRQQTQALLRELEANESAAYAEAEKVLDDTQRARAAELVAQQREERRRVRESRRGPPPQA